MPSTNPSPELDLLEQLSAEDQNLYTVLRHFGSPQEATSLTYAITAVRAYLRAGLVQLIENTGLDPRVVADWEIRAILEDASHWCSPDTRFFLQLTPHGYTTFVQDSAGFFDNLFSQTPKPGHKKRRKQR